MTAASRNRRPDFFLVGAPKAGTTGLSLYLSEHPRIVVSVPKETFYFCDDFPDMPRPGSEAEYLELFARATDATLRVGEATAIYLYSERAIPRIRAFAPDARILVMLRRPTEIATSFHAQQLYGLSEDVSDFETAWRLQESRRRGRDLPSRVREPRLLLYRDVALLGRQMQRLYETFPSQQVHTILFDDFVADPGSVYRSVLDFLEVPFDGREGFPVVNPRKVNRSARLAKILHRPPPAVSRAIARFKRTTGLERLGLLDFLRRANAAPVQKTEVSPTLEAELRESFREDVALLSSLVDHDLSGWI